MEVLNELSVPLVVLVAMTATLILVLQDWRWCLGVLAVQYVGVFLLITNHWPLSMAITKLVSGWIGCVVLALAGLEKQRLILESKHLRSWDNFNADFVPFTFSGKLLRWIAAGLVILAMVSLTSGVANWIPNAGMARTTAALILMGLGLLHLGVTSHPFRTVLGLLTVISGFDILYTAVEMSVLVAGLFSGVILGLSLTGAYLILLSPGEG